MSVRIRLHGAESECQEVVDRLAQVFSLLSVSEIYRDRGRSILVRVYIDAELAGGNGRSRLGSGGRTPPDQGGLRIT